VPPAQPVEQAASGLLDWGQVRAFRQQAAELLTAQLRDRAGLDEPSRREIGRALIVAMLNDHTDTLIGQGSPAPTPAAQAAMLTAVFDSLFSLGRLQSLVDTPGVENVEIRGFDQVHLVYGDGAVQVGPPVADSDEELIETLAFLAAQAGRSFTPLNWELDLRLHGGHRLAARAWRCPRPTVVIRVHRYIDVDLSDLQRLGMIGRVPGAAARRGRRGPAAQARLEALAEDRAQERALGLFRGRAQAGRLAAASTGCSDERCGAGDDRPQRGERRERSSRVARSHVGRTRFKRGQSGRQHCQRP